MKQTLKETLKMIIPDFLHSISKRIYGKIWGRDICWEDVTSYYLFGKIQCLSIRKAPKHFRIHILHIPIFFF